MTFHLIHPDSYHGNKNKLNFFEGWYYKILDKNLEHPLAIIPGIIHGNIIEEGHSFIQLLEGNQESHYLKYPKDCFHAVKKKFSVTINHNYFSLREIKLNHYSNDIQLIGNLRFTDVIPWPDSFLNPGSMGFYNYLFFMECYSQVCCLHGKIKGRILCHNVEVDYTDGIVYIEKNWGSQFPQSYIWVQANGFPDHQSALTVSLGKIPFLGTTFTGFLVSLLYDEEVFKFTTMNRSKATIEEKNGNVLLTFEKGSLRLFVETRCELKDFLSIKGPKVGKMEIDIHENIVSNVYVELIDLDRSAILFQGNSVNSGVEYHGDLASLMKK